MGRYYQGDIEGKFWFGCQKSTDAEFFGAREEQDFINYCVDDVDTVLIGIDKCKDALGDLVYLFDLAYRGDIKDNPDWQKLSEEKQTEMYEWFARLDIGMRILKYFMANPDDYCNFTAEL